MGEGSGKDSAQEGWAVGTRSRMPGSPGGGGAGAALGNSPWCLGLQEDGCSQAFILSGWVTGEREVTHQSAFSKVRPGRKGRVGRPLEAAAGSC